MSAPSPESRYAALVDCCRAQGSLAVAYSGGVDSTLLIRAAYDALGKNALALTARAAMLSRREEADAAAFAKAVGIRHEWVDLDIADIPHFFENPRDRCYHCKTAIMTALLRRADERHCAALFEASNTDDLGDYRPGRRAIEELGVKSPFLTLGLSKADVRELSRFTGLPSADKPSFACLASRVPYGESIATEKLAAIDAAESFLFSLGFSQLRVRHHGAIARVEVPADDLHAVADHAKEIDAHFKSLGFSFACLDLAPFASGRLNEV